MEMMKTAYKIGTKIKQKKNILDIIWFYYKGGKEK
jgi:hypothetical protein